MNDVDVRLMRLGLFRQPVEFHNCPELLEGFASILRGWTVENYSGTSSEPLVRFRKSEDGTYLWESGLFPTPPEWEKRPPETAMDAICDFHYEFSDWYLEEFPDHLCLHSAAVRINDALVVFPCRQKAGKSILTVQLAAMGYQVFCDDVLPIGTTGNSGIALGILPRLRLPLPETTTRELQTFIDNRQGPSDKYYVYVDLKDGEIAPLGTSLPIGALVLLNRKDAGAPEIVPVGQGEMLKEIINQNFAENGSPTLLFDRLQSVAAGSRCLSLSYSDAMSGAQALVDLFDGSDGEGQ